MKLSDVVGLDLFHDARALRSAVGGAGVIYDIRQITSYSYDSKVGYARHVLRLTPVDRRVSVCMRDALDIDPTGQRREGKDFFGNRMTWIALDAPHDRLVVGSRRG